MHVTTGKVVNTLTLKYHKFDLVYTLATGSDVDLAGHVSMVSTVEAETNIEVVCQFQTSVKNEGVFYTNSGLGFTKRCE